MRRSLLALTVTALSTPLLLGACGGASTPEIAEVAEPGLGVAEEASEAAPAASPDGLVTVAADEAAATLADPPEDLVVLDVRTPEEFAEGHLEGATVIDFYEPDFADRLAELDRSTPYVLYCRSGNRSGQTMALMDELGFQSVQEIDGGVLAWAAAGLPLTAG